MSKIKNPSFVDFVNWYRGNRVRFKINERRHYDELANLEDVPGHFIFECRNYDDYSKVDLSYRNPRCGSTVKRWHAIGYNQHFQVEGPEVLKVITELSEAGKIDAMDHPSLGDALVVLIEFREELDQLELRYTLNREGRLTYINATNMGLMRVVHRVGDRDD